MSELLLVLACGAATYLWRGLGVLLSGRVGTDSPAFVWVGCVAYAMIAGLTARVLLLPAGALAAAPLVDRGLACAAALTVFFVLTRRNLFAGVGAGFVTMVVLAHLRAAA
ncbi:MAG: AzlD domain-containing protein [Burkholderiales bacterium]|nr:MAG: AzlD domain-containing protein [Burkholderiales bacterium]